MDVTSDHSPLLTTVNWSSRGAEPVNRLRPDTIDEGLFTDLLRTALSYPPALTDPQTLEDIDCTAMNLTRGISEAYAKSAKRSLGQNTGQP